MTTTMQEEKRLTRTGGRMIRYIVLAFECIVFVFVLYSAIKSNRVNKEVEKQIEELEKRWGEVKDGDADDAR